MSKRAEEVALKAYPPETKKAIELLPRDWNKPNRTAFIQGYDQAVSDVLSWLDSNMTLGPGDTSELKREIKAHFL